MIGEYSLKMLCDKYKISSENIVNKNNNILTYGEYLDIEKTLDYLINIMHISQNNIEKCPSILYRNVNEIKNNVDYLKKQQIVFANIESCLHVLSSENSQLIDTYKYVAENYGVEAINKNTSILSCSIDIIKSIENLKLNLSNNGELTISVAIEYGYTNIEEIQKIIQSKEYQEHPELFTSTTLAHAKIEEIQKIIQSKEYQEHPELFTSTTLARAKLEEIQKLLSMPCWNDSKYKYLLTPSVVAKSKSMFSKLPILFEIAEYYGISENLNTCFLLHSTSQNYALIKFLEDNNRPLIIDGKLNPVFSKQPGVLKKKDNIDIKELMEKYPFDIDKIKMRGAKK